MVHRNVKYKTMAQAVNNTDGILVLASLFEVNGREGGQLTSVTFY